MMYTLKILEVMKVAQLKSVCLEYELKISGNKQELIDRIISHQEKITQEQVAWEKLMKHGAKERDDGFERVIRVFQQWSDENGFWPAKLNKSGVSFENVNINEIRSAFADYDPEASPLRKDRLVPTSDTKLEVFLDMFNKRDDWTIFDMTTQEREFDCDSEFNDTWFVKGMKELYNRQMRDEFHPFNMNNAWELVIA